MGHNQHFTVRALYAFNLFRLPKHSNDHIGTPYPGIYFWCDGHTGRLRTRCLRLPDRNSTLQREICRVKDWQWQQLGSFGYPKLCYRHHDNNFSYDFVRQAKYLQTYAKVPTPEEKIYIQRSNVSFESSNNHWLRRAAFLSSDSSNEALGRRGPQPFCYRLGRLESCR